MSVELSDDDADHRELIRRAGSSTGIGIIPAKSIDFEILNGDRSVNSGVRLDGVSITFPRVRARSVGEKVTAGVCNGEVVHDTSAVDGQISLAAAAVTGNDPGIPTAACFFYTNGRLVGRYVSNVPCRKMR